MPAGPAIGEIVRLDIGRVEAAQVSHTLHGVIAAALGDRYRHALRLAAAVGIRVTIIMAGEAVAEATYRLRHGAATLGVAQADPPGLRWVGVGDSPAGHNGTRAGSTRRAGRIRGCGRIPR